MRACIEEILELSSSQVRFYTVRFALDKLSEFEKFDNQSYTQEAHRGELQIIYHTIRQIGLRGARTNFFRFEGPAFALPGKLSKVIQNNNTVDFGLRLYAVIVNFNTVILMNGGIKTHIDPLQCPNVQDHFTKAQKCAVRILKAVNDDLIRFSFEDGMDPDDEDFSIDI